MENKLSIKIWSDIICPYCRIGKVRLEKALEASPLRGRYELIHKAFRLAPGSPVKKVEEALAQKMNISETQVLKMQTGVEEMAAKDGLKYDLHGTLYGDTIDAHRLVLWAAEKKLQSQLLDRIFAAYFSEKINIFDRANLLKLVSSVGISADDAEKMLASDAYRADVEADEEAAYSYGASGVPFFIFADKFAVGGAQSVENFSKVIEKIRSELD